MKQRVVHLINGLEIGGAEMMLVRLLEATDRERFEPAVISMLDAAALGPRIEALGIPVYTLGARRSATAALALPRLWRTLRVLAPDILHCWMYHSNLAGLVAGRLAGVRELLWAIHNSSLDETHSKPMTIWIARASARLAHLTSAIVCCSESALRVHADLGYPVARMVVIPNGFDVNRFRPDPEAYAALRTELGVAADACLIGLMARFDPQKDHRNFFRAAGLLLRDPRLDQSGREVHFVLCGHQVDAQNAKIREWIQEESIEERVHLLGLRDDMPRLMAALDVASSSSAFGEAFPLVLGEAMACAVPCVVTDVGDSARIVGDTGSVVPPRDPSALADAWLHMAHLPLEERAARGGSARDRILTEFCLPRVARRYETLYASLRKGSGAVDV